MFSPSADASHSHSSRTRHAGSSEQLFSPASVHLKWNQTIGAVEDNHPADNDYLSRFLPGAELKTQYYGSPRHLLPLLVKTTAAPG